jgi:hypothetical protein
LPGGSPVFEDYSDSSEEYSSFSITPSSQSRGGRGDKGATARRGAPTLENHSQPDGYPESILGNHLSLIITYMPQSHFVYWKGLEPSELLDYESHLVAFMQELPFQEGKPHSPITEEGDGSIELLEYSHTANNSPDRQVYMASLRNLDDDELGLEYNDEQLADVSADEPTADAPPPPGREREAPKDSAGEERQARPAQAKLKKSCSQSNVPKEPQQRFCSSHGSGVLYTIGAITEAALLAQKLPPNPQIQGRQYLTKRTLMQLDGQHPVSSTRNLPSRFERHGETMLIGRTPRGGLGNRRNDSRHRNEGHPSARGNDEQEVQQPTHQPRNQHGCHTRFRKDNQMHPICAPASSSAHIVDVASVYPKQYINEIEYKSTLLHDRQS